MRAELRRSDQTSQVAVSIPTTGRLSLPVTRNSAQPSVSPQVGRSSTVQASSSPLVPRREDIAPANPFSEKSNPFGSPTSDESLGEDNPFAENNQTQW